MDLRRSVAVGGSSSFGHLSVDDSQSGALVVRTAPPCPSQHAVRLFHDDEYPARRIAEHLETALLSGGAALVVATDGHLAAIRVALGLLGVDERTLTASRQVVMLDAEQVANAITECSSREAAFAERVARVVRDLLRDYPRIAAYGEIVDVLTRRGDVIGALQLERWWNELLEGAPIELLCGYGIRSFARIDAVPLFRGICAEHGTAEPTGREFFAEENRAAAELEQMSLALESEASLRGHAEEQRDRLHEAESNQRKRAERAAEHLARLQHFTSSLSEAAGAAEIGRIVVSVLGAEFRAEAARMATPMVETKDLFVLHHSGQGAEAPVPESETVSRDSSTPLATAFRTGEELRLAVPTEIATGRSLAVEERAPGSTVLAVPIVAGRRVLGAVELVYRAEHHLSPVDRALFDDYLRQTALALDRARSYEEARKATTRLQLLADAAVQIAAAGLDLTAIAETVVREVTRTDFAQLAALHLVSNDGGEPSLAALADVAIPGQRQEDEEPFQALRSEILVEVARTGRTHLVSLPSEHLGPEAGVVGMITVPLRTTGEVTGTLTAVRRRPASSFSADDERILHDLATRAALSIENALLYQQAQVERKRAEAASRAKDEFLAMLGHELRNPLSPILTAVHLMRLRGGDTLTKERTIIERQVNHMVRLVDDLLDVSRIARRKIQLKIAPVDLCEVVANALEIASPALEEKSHRLVTTIPEEGLVVNADRNRLAQAIVNLLTNAARYTPPKGTIGITAEERSGVAILHVTDNGVGIELDLLPKIFQLFVQGGQTSDRPRGGLGLGLAIAESLVEMHGGALRAASEGPGKGSRFTIELPLLPDQDVRPERPSEPPAMATRGVARRVLVVEDNTDAAEALGEFLEDLGHVVRLAHDGPEALRIAPEMQPDVALLDIGLPGMDGYELAERLVALLGDKRPRLVALTGYGQRADRERSRSAGFDEHLVKPVGVERLQSVIAGEPSDDSGAPPPR